MTISIYNSYNLVPGVNNFNVSDEIIVRDSLDVYEVIELDFGNTKQSLNFGPNQYADYGNALDSLDAFDSFAISFWIRQDNGDNSPIFSLYDSEQYSIVDLSSESNSLTLLGEVSGSVRVPISTGRASLFISNFNDGIRVDSALDSINFNSPYSIEYRWSRGSPDNETNTMFSISKGHNDVLTVDGTGIIVNNVKLSFDDPAAVSHSHADIIASRTKTLNPELLWDHYALGYDGLDYKFFKSGAEVSYTRDEKYMAKKGDLQFTDLPDLRNDAGFQTWAYFPQDAGSHQLFHAGDSTNKVVFKTQGNNLILKAGGDDGPSLTVDKPQAGKHNIAWDIKIDPGQVRLWINDSHAGTSSIATSLPGKKWAGDGIVPLINYTNTYSGNIARSRSMVGPGRHDEYIEGSGEASPWSTTETFEDCNDGSFKYYTHAPSTDFWHGPGRWYQYYYYHSIDKARKNHGLTLRDPPDNGQGGNQSTFRNSRATQGYSYRRSSRWTLPFGPVGARQRYNYRTLPTHLWTFNYPSRNHVTLSDVTISKGGTNIYYYEYDYKNRPYSWGGAFGSYCNDVILHLSEKGFRSNTSFFFGTPDQGKLSYSSSSTYPSDNLNSSNDLMQGINTTHLVNWKSFTGDLVPSESVNPLINNFRSYETAAGGGVWNACDQWFISEPDEKIFHFKNGKYNMSFDFPPSGTHFEPLFFKGKFGYRQGAYQGSPSYGSMAGTGLPGEAEWLLNRYVRYNFSPDTWEYDPSRLIQTIPVTERPAVAGSGSPAGYGKLGSALWPADLKDSLYTYPIAFDDYKDATFHIGAKLKDLSNPDETGLQYANKFISETGGSIVNYTGAQGSDIKDAINNTNNGDALILPVGDYTMSYNNGRDIFNGKNILICGSTNNMRDVKIDLTNSGSYYVFENTYDNHYSRAELAYLSVEGWTYSLVYNQFWSRTLSYGNYGNHKMKNVMIDTKRGDFLYNSNSYPGKNTVIENCVFSKKFRITSSYNTYNFLVKNCIFALTSGQEQSTAPVDYIPTFAGINKTGVDVNFKTTSDSNQYLDIPYDLIKDVNKDFTSYVYDFNILDSNRYDSIYDVSISNAYIDDSHTKLSIAPIISKGNIFTYTSRASATSIRPAFIVDNELLEGDSFPIPNGAEWEYQSIQYNGTSLKLYIDGVLNSEINANLDFNEIKNTSLLLGRLSNYEFTENRFRPEYNTNLNLRDFVVTRGQTYLADFTRPADSYGTIGANDVLFTATGAPYPDMPGITNYNVGRPDISPFDHPLSGKSFLKVSKLNQAMDTITLGTDVTKQNQTVQIVDFTSTLDSTDFTRPNYEINLRNFDDRNDSISWSYETTMPRRLIDIRSDSAKDRFYIDPTNSTETDFTHSLGIIFTGKNKIYPDRGPWLMGPDNAHISDSYRPDMTLVYDYHPAIGLSISAMSDPHVSRFQITTDGPITIDSSRYLADPFNILTPEKL